MKRIYAFLTVLLLTVGLRAQSFQGFSYQAVVRSSDNELVVEKPVGMKVSLLQGSDNGSEVYVETHVPSTNKNGLISVGIGNGVKISGDFMVIDWSKGPYFIKTEIDPTGGSSYVLTITSQLLSVPYAHYSFKSDVSNTSNVSNSSKIADSIRGKDFFWNKAIDTSIIYNDVYIGGKNKSLVNGFTFSKLTKDNREVQGVTSYLQSTLSHSNWLIGSKNIVFGQGKGVHVGVLGSGGRDLNYIVNKNVRYGVMGMSTDTLSVLEYNNGVYGLASGNKKMNIGIDGTAASSVGDNYANTGWAWGKTAGSNYGLYGYASQSTTANYGVVGEVDKSVLTGVKYSGYFKGAPLGVADDNLYIKDFNKGVVLTSPDGKCHQVKVDNSGNLVVTTVDCPK